MPLNKGYDKKGYFYRWGEQKKYYYNPNSQKSATEAAKKALRQGRAIGYSKYHNR